MTVVRVLGATSMANTFFKYAGVSLWKGTKNLTESWLPEIQTFLGAISGALIIKSLHLKSHTSGKQTTTSFEFWNDADDIFCYWFSTDGKLNIPETYKVKKKQAKKVRGLVCSYAPVDRYF